MPPATPTPHLVVVVLGDRLPERLDLLATQLLGAEDLVLAVEPELDVVGRVHEPVALQHLAQPLGLVLQLRLGRAEGQRVVLVRLAAIVVVGGGGRGGLVPSTHDDGG